jgi:hypothetical protein
MPVRRQHLVLAGKSAHQHQERRLGQMEIREQRSDNAELESRVNE